jgi:uncharacterized protein YaaR (DUF327 family)
MSMLGSRLSLTELLTEMVHYTEVIKRYIELLDNHRFQSKAKAISNFGAK